MKKNYLALFFSILWTSTLFAVDYQTIDGIDYMLDASTNSASVTGTPSGAVTIPPSVKYNNRTYNVTEITAVNNAITSLVVPEGVTTIVANLCYKKTALTSVTLPSTILRIEKQAFFGCYSLISINLPEGLTYIGDEAFGGCSVLPTITIPSTLTSMGIRAFGGSKNLTKIVWNAKHCVDFTSENVAPFISSSISTYNDYTTSITFGEEVEYIPAYLCCAFLNLSTITIPNSVKEIGSRAFLGLCWFDPSDYYIDSKLQSVKLGSGLEKIGTLAFADRTGLVSITIPDKCTEIGSSAFGTCSNLQTVTFGKNINIISDDAFSFDYNLNTINIYANTPPVISYKVFDGYSDLKAITLNVRSGSYDAYNAANVWKDMYIQVLEKDLRTYTLSVSSADESKGVTTSGGEYDEDSEILIYASPKSGYQFSKWNDGNTDNPRTVKMTGDLSFTAQFEAATPKYKITVMSTNDLQGSVFGDGSYEAGTKLLIAAFAKEGYHFTQWNDGNTDNPRIVTVSADANFFASFAQDEVAPTLYELNIAPEVASQGWTTEGCAYESGAEVMVYAHPADGYEFSQWSDGKKDNPRFITVTAEVNLTAQFVVKALTDVNAVKREIPAQKILRDGQLFILRDGEIYNAQGAKVE